MTHRQRIQTALNVLDLGPGGGYVVAPVHNIQGDVPAGNVVSLYQSARQYGRYPLTNR